MRWEAGGWRLEVETVPASGDVSGLQLPYLFSSDGLQCPERMSLRP